MKKTTILLVGVLIFCGLGNLAVEAKDYPTKPIKFIIPSSAGGMGDVTGRLLAKVMEKHLGQPVLPENKAGGGGGIGLTALAKAKPDGYTIANSNPGGIILVPKTRDVPYTEDSFAKVAVYIAQEIIMWSTPDAPYKTFKELIKYAKQHPNEVRVGNFGATWSIMLLRMIAKHHGLQWKIVPFKGGGEGSAAILGGHVKAGVGGAGTPADQAARAGKLNMLAIFSRGHLDDFPKVPNLEDLGYDFFMMSNRVILAPAGTPEPVRQKLEDVIKKAVADPDFTGPIGKLKGVSPFFVPGRDYGKMLKEGAVVIDRGIKEVGLK
jgi:tripartite-type tricarboxylate transporter receptor subunit TctC